MMVRLIARATRHHELRATCFPRGGVPTLPPFLTCLFCQKMGGLKITGFLKIEKVHSSNLATWRVGVRKPKKAFMASRRPCVSPGNMSFQ